MFSESQPDRQTQLGERALLFSSLAALKESLQDQVGCHRIVISSFLITFEDCLCFPDRCHFDPLPHQAEERQSIEELDQAAFDVLDPSLIRFV